MKKTWMLCVAVLLMATVAQAATFTMEGAFDYETVSTSLLWWSDPNGGIGIEVIGDSTVPGGWEDNLAIGPVCEFDLNGLVNTIFNTVLPPFAGALGDVPAKMYGKLGLLMETGGTEDLVFLAGTGVKFLPDRWIQPTIWFEYVRPEGNSDITQDVKAMFGATVVLGKKK